MAVLTLHIYADQVFLRHAALKKQWVFTNDAQAEFDQTWFDEIRAVFTHEKLKGSCQVFLGAPYVTWLVDTWPQRLKRQNDYLTYLQHQLAGVSGKQQAGDTWNIVIGQRTRPGDSVLVCAIRAAWLNRVKSLIDSTGVKCKGIKPCLPAERFFNIQADAVVCMQEARFTTAFAIKAGQWVGVRCSQDRQVGQLIAAVYGIAFERVVLCPIEP